MITRQDVFAHAALCAHDDIHVLTLLDSLKETGLWERMGGTAPRRKINAPPPPAPAKSRITAIRTALFDNWPGGTYVKKHPNRYAIAIEMWDLPAGAIEVVKVRSMNFTFKCNMALMNRKSLLSQIRSLRKPRKNELSTVDPDYLDQIEEMSNGRPTSLIGLVNTTVNDDTSEYHRGVYYHPYQLVVVDMDRAGKVLDAMLITSPTDIIKLAPFVESDWAGDPLKGNVVAQSRTDLVGFDSGWAS